MAVRNAGRPGVFAIRDVSTLVTETHEAGHELKRAVSASQLTAMGVGAIIGTGIFVVIGQGAVMAGPGVILSFVLAAIACVFSALSYAELASSIPVSGSAYTYAYATLGELVAWIIGWDLILEYGVSVAAVAVGWGGNLNAFFDAAFGFKLPHAISASPSDGGVFNLPAVFIVLAITFVLVLGVRESARTNMVMVVVKLVILTFFIVIAMFNFSTANFHPFLPHGASAVTSAAAIIFFAFIGFDAVSTGSEEARHPERDLPVAIIGSLAICTAGEDQRPTTIDDIGNLRATIGLFGAGYLVMLAREITAEFGTPYYSRLDVPATAEQKAKLEKLSPEAVKESKLAGEPITARLTNAPGNDAPIGGLKIVTASGWFAARPSGTESLYKIYAESLRNQAHLDAIVNEAQEIVNNALGAPEQAP